MLVNNKDSLEGRSLLLNILFISLNILGLSFLVMGYHPHFEANALLFKILGYGLMAATLGLLYVFKGFILFAYVSRVLVGGLFIVSGLIKANDPKGFAYKLEEYFEDGALAFRIKEWFHWETFSLEFLIESALTLSIIILIFEVVLGILILLGAKLKSSSWLLLLLMIFFTFLTWHTKECDPNATFADVDKYPINSAAAQAKIPEAEINDDITIVKQTETYVLIREMKRTQCVNDCGCFGDAMKGSIGRSLTPAESYWKDIVLLYFGILIFASRRRISLNDAKENIVLIVAGLLFIGFFSYIFTWSFPIFFAIIALALSLWVKRIGGKIFGNEFGMILTSILITGLFTIYVLLYLPIRDYRPYHVGSDLIERMNDGIEGEYLNVMVYTNKQDNTDTTITVLNETTKAIWGDTTTWKFSKRDTKTIKEGRLPSIQQFDPSMDIYDLTEVEKEFGPISTFLEENKVPYVQLINTDNGEIEDIPLEEIDFFIEDLDTSFQAIGDTILKLDEYVTEVSLKDYILEQEQIILIFSRNLKEGDFRRIERLKEIAENAKENGIDVVMITASRTEEIEEFREKTGLLLPTVQNDDIEIKAITRSNPSLMVLQNAVVKGKYPYRSTPSWKWLNENILNIK